MPSRVLFPYVGDSVGGSHVSSITLACALPPEFEPIFTVQQEGPLSDYLRARGLEPLILPDVPLPRLRPYWRQPNCFRTLTRVFGEVLSDLSPSIVHTNDLRMHAAWVFPCLKSRVPHVWHQRTPSPSRHTHSLSRYSAARIAVSEFSRASLPRRMSRRTRVIYNPVKLPETNRATAREKLLSQLGLADRQVSLIVWVANFTSRKKPDVFLRMARRMVDDAPDRPLHFLMVGAARSPTFEESQALVDELGLAAQVTFTGFVDRVEEIVAGSDLLVAPAISEAFGRTLVEAMLSDVPVVASMHGGHTEIIRNGETGLLVEPGRSDKFAEAALTLLNEPDRASRLAQAAKSDVLARFSVEKHVSEITKVYREVLGERA